MKVLAFDTAAAACAVAVLDEARVVERRQPMARGHAEALLPLILEVLGEAGLSFADLDLLAVTVGPGAFTGLRVGLAAARGLRLASGLPCLGVPTLAALAATARRQAACQEPVLAVLDSKRGDVYAQLFAADGAPAGAAQAVAIDSLPALVPAGGVRVAGDAAETVTAALRAAGIPARSLVIAAPSAAVVAALARARWQAGERDLSPPEPLYLRAPLTGPRLAVSAAR